MSRGEIKERLHQLNSELERGAREALPGNEEVVRRKPWLEDKRFVGPGSGNERNSLETNGASSLPRAKSRGQSQAGRPGL